MNVEGLVLAPLSNFFFLAAFFAEVFFEELDVRVLFRCSDFQERLAWPLSDMLAALAPL